MKSHNVAGSQDGAQTDYQVKFVVYSGSGTDNGQNVYLNGHSLSWPNDMRFTDADNNLLSYWIESSNANMATVWVKISNIPAYPASVTINMFYGKSGETSASNGVSTFPFFDDFPGPNMDTSKWTNRITAGSYTINSGVLSLTPGASGEYAWFTNAIFNQGYKAVAKVKTTTSASHMMFGFNAYGQTAQLECMSYLNDIAASYSAETHWNVPHTLNTPTDTGNYHQWMIKRNNGHFTAYYDGSPKYTATDDATSDMSVFIYAYNQARISLDYVFVAKDTPNEPTHSTWSTDFNISVLNNPLFYQYYNASIVSDTIPLIMESCHAYNVSITMNNTGMMSWSNDSHIALEIVGDQYGIKFSNNTINIQNGVVVQPGQTYTFNLTMLPPTIPGTYNLSYRMVLGNGIGFGDYTNKTVTVQAVPDAEFMSDTIPSTMTARDPYSVSITVSNSGTMSWSDDRQFVLAITNDSNNDASLFSYFIVNITQGVTVEPGQTYTFNIPMTAPPVAGTFNLSYRMAWMSQGWFGETFNKTVTVPVAPNAKYLGDTIPMVMATNQTINVSITMQNTGTMPWSNESQMALVAIDNGGGDAAKFSGLRFNVTPEVTVRPGENYTFYFTMTAPWTTGSYQPSYRMYWEGHDWFGGYANKSVLVTMPAYDSIVQSTNLPDTLHYGGDLTNYYIAFINNGSMAWNPVGVQDCVYLRSVEGHSTSEFGQVNIPVLNYPVPYNCWENFYLDTVHAYVIPGTYTFKVQLFVNEQPFGQIFTKTIRVNCTGPTPTPRPTWYPTPEPSPLPDLSITVGDISFEKVG